MEGMESFVVNRLLRQPSLLYRSRLRCKSFAIHDVQLCGPVPGEACRSAGPEPERVMEDPLDRTWSADAVKGGHVRI